MEKSSLPFHYFGNDIGKGQTDIKPQGCACIWRGHVGDVSWLENCLVLLTEQLGNALSSRGLRREVTMVIFPPDVL